MKHLPAHVPKPADNSETFFYKISKRFEDDISAVCMALYIEHHNGVIVQAKTGFGGMAATPVSSTALEEALINQSYTQESFEQAAQILLESEGQDLTPMSDVRASKTYRMEVAANLVRRAWYESSACAETVLVRVSHA